MPAEVRARGLPGSEGAQAALTFRSGTQLHEEGTDDHYRAAAAIDVEKLMGFTPCSRHGGACCTRYGACSPHEQPYRQRTGKARSRCRHRPAASQRAQRKEGIDDD